MALPARSACTLVKGTHTSAQLAPDAVLHDVADDVRSVRVGRLSLRVSVRPGTTTAPPLVMIMGLGGNIEMWEPFRRRVIAHSSRTTVAFDAPGTGESSTPSVPLTMAALGRLTLRLVEHLRLPTIDLIGYSFGGVLAQQIALLAPRRVRRLVLASTNYGAGSIPGRPAAMAALMSPGRYHSAEKLRELSRVVYGGRSAREPDLLMQGAEARVARPPSTRGYLYQCAAASSWSSLPWLPLIRQRTLVVAGDDDPLIPLSNARVLTRGIPRARLHVVNGGGHLVLLDQARDVAPVIGDFLAG